MAESESAPKLSEFYVGIVDLFVTILPGAIITYTVFASSALREKFALGEGAKFWTVFLAASYVTGHIVSAMGGVLLDDVYDTVYKIRRKRKGLYEMRIRAKRALETRLKPYFLKSDNALNWSDVTVRLDSGAAIGEIDRLEADSKFFRSLVMVVALAWPVYVAVTCFRNLTWRSWLSESVASGVPAAAIVCLWLYVKAKEQKDRSRKQKEEEESHHTTQHAKSMKEQVEDEINDDTSLQRMCWTATRWAIGFWFVGFAASGFKISIATGFVGVGLSLLGIFSAWRFMERRLKRTTLTYTYVVALASAHAGVEEKKGEPAKP